MDSLLNPILETAFRAVTWSLLICSILGLVLAWIGWEVIGATLKDARERIKRGGLGPVGQFLIKTVIVSVATVVSAWIVLDVLDDFATRRMQQLERTIRSVTAIGGRQFWTELEGRLDRLADPSMELPPEKKEKILMQIKVISDRWRPLLLEVAAAIDGDTKNAR
jgi:hypothetical protein